MLFQQRVVFCRVAELLKVFASKLFPGKFPSGEILLKSEKAEKKQKLGFGEI